MEDGFLVREPDEKKILIIPSNESKIKNEGVSLGCRDALNSSIRKSLKDHVKRSFCCLSRSRIADKTVHDRAFFPDTVGGYREKGFRGRGQKNDRRKERSRSWSFPACWKNISEKSVDREAHFIRSRGFHSRLARSEQTRHCHCIEHLNRNTITFVSRIGIFMRF